VAKLNVNLVRSGKKCAGFLLNLGDSVGDKLAGISCANKLIRLETCAISGGIPKLATLKTGTDYLLLIYRTHHLR